MYAVMPQVNVRSESQPLFRGASTARTTVGKMLRFRTAPEFLALMNQPASEPS